MSDVWSSLQTRSRAESFGDEALSVLVGVAFTLGLFLTMAHFENTSAPQMPVAIDDLRVVSVPVEPPPPKIVEHPEVAESAAPLAGLEISSS